MAMKKFTAAIVAASVSVSLAVAPAHAADAPTKNATTNEATVAQDSSAPKQAKEQNKGECRVEGSSTKDCVPSDFDLPKPAPLERLYTGVSAISVPLFFVALGLVGKWIYDTFFAPNARGLGPIAPVKLPPLPGQPAPRR